MGQVDVGEAELDARGSRLLMRCAAPVVLQRLFARYPAGLEETYPWMEERVRLAAEAE